MCCDKCGVLLTYEEELFVEYFPEYGAICTECYLEEELEEC